MLPVLTMLVGVCRMGSIVGTATPVPRLSNYFESHMVLQRDRPIVVWGFNADPNEIVAVQIGDAAVVLSSPAGTDGAWEATLPASAVTVGGVGITMVVASPVALWGDSEPRGQGGRRRW